MSCEIKNEISFKKCMSSKNNNYIVNPTVVVDLIDDIIILPYQINNDLYRHLKDNLIKRYAHKYYKNIGFILDIYEIKQISDGLIVPERADGSIQYTVKFTCLIYKLIINTTIIARVLQNNISILHLAQNPSYIDVEHSSINKTVFAEDNNTHQIKVIGGDILKQGDFVKVRIIDYIYNNNDTKVLAIGFLENVVSDAEVEDYYNKYYDEEVEKLNNI